MKFLILVFVCFNALHAQTLSTSETKNYIGESHTVCGTVKSAHYSKSSNGAPTFINLDGSYPNQPFNIVIWEDYRSAFKSAPETYYMSKKLCVTGTIDEYKSVPNIEARSPSQIKVK